MIKDAVIDILSEESPLTVRGLFYRLVARGHLDKTEREYQSTVRYVGQLRLAGALPWMESGRAVKCRNMGALGSCYARRQGPTDVTTGGQARPA